MSNKLISASKKESVDLPLNSFTLALDVHGELYPIGGLLGNKISADMSDEDLDSALRAIHGASLSLQRTLAVTIARRDPTYKLPGDTVEQDLTPLVDKIAEVEVEKAENAETDGPKA